MGYHTRHIEHNINAYEKHNEIISHHLHRQHSQVYFVFLLTIKTRMTHLLQSHFCLFFQQQNTKNNH
jgi:hypothetical protein